MTEELAHELLYSAGWTEFSVDDGYGRHVKAKRWDGIWAHCHWMHGDDAIGFKTFIQTCLSKPIVNQQHVS